MSTKRYMQELKIEAVKQVIDRGHSVADVASRPGISIQSLYAWRKQYANSSSTHPAEIDQAYELRRRKAAIKMRLRGVYRSRGDLRRY